MRYSNPASDYFINTQKCLIIQNGSSPSTQTLLVSFIRIKGLMKTCVYLIVYARFKK